MFLSPEASAEPGRMNLSRAPYQREMLDAIADPEIEDVVIMSSAQIGKTSMQLCIAGFLIDLQPCPILWVAPTLQMAEATSKDRLAPMFRDSPCFADKIKPPTARNSGNTLLSKAFPGGQLVLAGANSPASLASRPIRAVIGDEIDRFPESAGTEGDPLNLARKRTTTFWNRLHIWVSTPTIKDRSRIEKLFHLSDRRRYHVPCPHCGHRQVLQWEGLIYKDKGSVDLTKADVEEVRYQCASCGESIEETAKLQMLSDGQWVAEGKRGSIAGFHLNELYSPWKSWADVARDYEAAQGDPLRMQVFWNTSLGLPYEHDGRTKFDWETLQLRAEDSEYFATQIPEGVLLLTAGVDVQGDRLECSIFGWGAGEEWWLIAHYVLHGDPLQNTVWQDLDMVLAQEYQHPLGATIKIRKVAVDSSYNTKEVYFRGRGKSNWLLIKGDEGFDRPTVGKPKWREINWKGQYIKQGVKLYILGVDVIKQTLLSRCRIAAPGPKYLHVPQDVPPHWCQEFAGSEVMVRKKQRATWRYSWEPVPGVRNEPLDCAVYAYAAADFCGLSRYNKSHWSKIRNQLTVAKPLQPGKNDDPISNRNVPESSPEPEPPKEKKQLQRRQRAPRRSGYLSRIGL